MAKPIIGIPAERRLLNGSYRNSVNQGEVAAVVKAGGVPVLIPTREPELAANYSQLIDGLLLPGGVDVAPHFYNEEPIPEMAESDDPLDETEIALTKQAVEAGQPILGICRGTQLLNVALGGSLFQDIRAQINHPTYKHTQTAAANQGTHYIDVSEGSLLQEIFNGQQHLLVNSLHHQAVKKVAPQLKVTAKASDGIIECVESKDSNLIVAVQWHPELMFKEDALQFAIFEDFITRVKNA